MLSVSRLSVSIGNSAQTIGFGRLDPDEVQKQPLRPQAEALPVNNRKNSAFRTLGLHRQLIVYASESKRVHPLRSSYLSADECSSARMTAISPYGWNVRPTGAANSRWIASSLNPCLPVEKAIHSPSGEKLE